MKTFKDGLQREWAIELNVGAFKRSRADFGDLLNPEFFLEKVNDAVFLVDLLFFLCKAKAVERNIDSDSFANAFFGDSVEEAREALTQEYVDFFPSRARKVMKAALEKINLIKTEMLERQAENLQQSPNPSATSGEEDSSN